LLAFFIGILCKLYKGIHDDRFKRVARNLSLLFINRRPLVETFNKRLLLTDFI